MLGLGPALLTGLVETAGVSTREASRPTGTATVLVQVPRGLGVVQLVERVEQVERNPVVVVATH